MGYGCILPSARPQLPISNWHQPRQPPARVGGSPRLSLMWKPLALLILLVVAASPLQAQSPDPAAGVPLCDRTEQVQDAILSVVGAIECAEVSDADIAGITELDMENVGISSLQAVDFSGLAALEELHLGENNLVELPEGLFSGLSSLLNLSLNDNNLASLPPGIFDGLTNLYSLRLHENSLTTLPAGLFSDLTELSELQLQDNPGSAGFLPTANAGVEQNIMAGQIVILSAAVGDADPWGDNVRYYWEQNRQQRRCSRSDGNRHRPPQLLHARRRNRA